MKLVSDLFQIHLSQFAILMRKILPNLFTLSGALAGLIAIFLLVQEDQTGKLLLASKLILIAILFDALDGYTARHFRVTSKFGIQLDALSDLLSCGIAPSLLLFQMTRERFPDLGILVAILLPLFAMIRLARSLAKGRNQGEKVYRGLPLPILGSSISLLVLFTKGMPLGASWVLFSILLMGILLMTDLHYPKIIYKKGIGWTVYASLLFLLFLPEPSFLAGLLLFLGGSYILFGFTFTYRHHRQNKKMEFEILPTPVEKPR